MDRLPSRWPLALFAVLVLAAACSCSRGEGTDPALPAVDPALPALDADFEPLRAAFDADAAHVRLLAILSPT